jgi:pathogenesis-related protein 1
MKNFCATGTLERACHPSRMRWILVLLASCEMYSKPASEEPAVATTEMEAPPPPAKSKAPKDPFAKAFVDAHNAARAKNCAAPLTWSPQLAKIAQSWAEQLKAKGCVFGHSGNNKYGENLAAGTIGALDPESTVAMWYDEIKLYKFPDGGFSMQTGHFTQLVWTTTRQVGCGHVQCKGNDIYVCNYDPPGNFEGEYRTHVLSTKCKK